MKARSGEPPDLRRHNSDGLVSRDGINGVGIRYSSGVPTLPQRNNAMNYMSLCALSINGR
jgi:hypothetical protein